MLLSTAAQRKTWIRWLIGLSLVPIFVLKLLFGTLLGVLLVSLALYASLPHLMGTEPWGGAQLAVWFDELGIEAKVGLASSLVTVLGFFIALQTTMHSWQRQTAATMRMAAADSIDRVITEVSGIILQVQLFTEATANEVARVREGMIPPEAAPMLSPLSEDVLTFRANRQRLLQLQQELLALPARYAVLFLPLSGMQAALEAVGEQVSVVTKKIWVGAPAGGTEHPEHRRQLVEFADPAKYMELSRACEVAHEEIAGLQGGLRGALFSPLLELNAVSVGRMIRQMFRRTNDN